MSAKLYNDTNDELLVSIESEYKMGLILCPYLNEEFEKYEKTKTPLEDYFPVLIKNLDFKKEKKRLAEFNNKNKK
jgi:hypothetical protein